MKIVLGDSFDENLGQAPQSIQKAFWKQAGFLEKNIRHPSLRAKKYDGANNIWQARVTKGWRFYFTIFDDTYVIIKISKHPK